MAAKVAPASTRVPTDVPQAAQSVMWPGTLVGPWQPAYEHLEQGRPGRVGLWQALLMSVGTKLQIKPGATVAVLGLPGGVEVDLPDGCSSHTDAAAAQRADAVIVFTSDSNALEAIGQPAVDAALEDRLAWVAYPKAGKLGTDLNRDVLARIMFDRGAQPVRQVAVDDVWSALRFRPAK